VESTVEAVLFYEKSGFKEAGTIAIDLGGLSDHGNVDIYKEAGCIYMPKARAYLRTTTNYPRHVRHPERLVLYES
jgi:hypothetical protein